MTTRAQIVACARSYIGTPFQHQGRLKGYGLDCIGLPICVGRDLGLKITNYVNYDPQPSDDTVLRECRKNLPEIAPEEIAPGDILCLRVPVPCHLAIVSDLPPGLGIIHAYRPNMMVVETSAEHWIKRIAAAFRYSELEDVAWRS